jgi:guanylate kinase
MLVLASPSGAGKSTLTRLLLEEDRHLTLSVSVTTRPRRSSEVDGVHYHFITPGAFQSLKAGGGLLESAEIHGHRYGTPRAPVEEALRHGRDILFDVDYQGTLQLYECMREDIVSVFILPPSARELQRRLVRRAEDAPAVIRRRLQTAYVELQHWDKFDYVLVNDDLQQSYAGLRAILASARLQRQRQPGIADFANGLRDDLADIIGSEADQAGSGAKPA